MFSVEDLDQPEEHHEEIEDAEAEAPADSKSTPVVKKVRKQSTRPKLDVQRLKGPRGLAVIEKLFSKTKFKGHGHEQEDLKTVMRTLHYWCHRLFPKWTFDDTLTHLERLGNKKPVMTLKRKILYNMLDDEPVIRMDLDQEVEDIEAEDIPQNDFDMLLQTLPSTSHPIRVTPPELTQDQKDMIAKNRLLAADRRKARLEAQQQIDLQIPEDVIGSLTDEQKLQMEQNRLLAIERRMSRLNPQEDSTAQVQEMIEDSQECIQNPEHVIHDVIQVQQEDLGDEDSPDVIDVSSL